MSDVLPAGTEWPEWDGAATPTDAHKWFGGAAGLPVIGADDVLEPVIQFYRRDWTSSDGGPPGWGELGMVGGFGVWHSDTFGSSVTLSRAQKSVFVAYEGAPPDRFALYRQLLWRVAWRLRDPATCWSFVHMRWKERQWVQDTHGAQTFEDVGDLKVVRSHTRGESDPDAPLTWPGTEWVEAEMPSLPDPAAPLTGSAGNVGMRAIHCLWPRRINYGINPEGLIPGAIWPTGIYSRPISEATGGALVPT